ncbi:MAG: Wzt carbohydrate-binding domain-containing protein, partial [Leptospiraceae bacterium]|nr:Wzt carbohydrate-binding domain-containing protein [Leptospiraceae bacterium]
GDAKFQAKCFNKLKELIDHGTTVLFVSHSTEQITTHCDHAILLNHWKVLELGEPRKIVNLYLDLLFGKKPDSEQVENVGERKKNHKEIEHFSELNSGFELRPYYNASEHRWGDKKAGIIDFVLYQEDEKFPSVLSLDKRIQLEFRVHFFQEILIPIFGFALKTKEGVTIYNTNSDFQKDSGAVTARAGDEWYVKIEMPMVLYTGDYFVSVGLASRAINAEIVPHDRRYDSIHLQVGDILHFTGLVDLKAKISVKGFSHD